MDPEALAPYGLALWAYYGGNHDAQLIVRRDDGLEVSLPASHFFRPAEQFSPIEVAALECCRGHVLDIGAGTGLHSLELQSRGLLVTAVDLDPRAAEIMHRRGVQHVVAADISNLYTGLMDTCLLLGHGIGMVRDLDGLKWFLAHAHEHTRNTGQFLLDSLDVRATDDPKNLDYHDANVEAGRYVGTTRIQFEFEGNSGPYCQWLHVDPRTLADYAEATGWMCEILLEVEGGGYLARLTP